MIQSNELTAKYEASIYSPPYFATIAIRAKSDFVCGKVFIFASCRNFYIFYDKVSPRY